MISTLFTSLLAIWLLILSARVIALRGALFLKFFAFNNFGEKALSRSVRAQANFIEYTPFFLILLFIAAQPGQHQNWISRRPVRVPRIHKGTQQKKNDDKSS